MRPKLNGKRMTMRLLKCCWPNRLALVCLAALLISGCVAGKGSFNKGEEALSKESYDQAVASFLEAVQKNPDKQEFRMKLKLARSKAAQAHKVWGDQFLERKEYLKALEEYQLAVDLDGSLFSAVDGLELAGRYLQAEKLTADAESLLQARRILPAKEAVAKALDLVPTFQPALRVQQRVKSTNLIVLDGQELEVASDQPITLNFKEAKLPDVFEIITKLSGINFILDEEVRGNNTTLFLERATFAQALELLLRMNKLDKKVLNSKTIILFPKSRDKQKQFEDQLIHTFYLSNIDAKKAVNLLRTMLQVRKIYVHEELNAIIIRDTPEVIKLAQKILEANDRANSEVVFDLELIEVNHSDTRELGLKLSNYSVSAGLGTPVTTTGTGGTTTATNIVSSTLSAGTSAAGLIGGVDGFKDLTPFYAIPTATFRLMKTQVDAEVLASPKIRVKNREKAKVHVGSKEPSISVTISGDQTTESVQYVDVGVKLNVEPTVQLDNTIVTKLGLEVSNVTGRDKTTNGTLVLTISTTNADTVLTLKDGEQTVIGGLIRDDKSVTKSKVPFLGDIPLLGELFNGTDKTDNKREILLSITPHIVKTVSLPQGDVASIWSGGEDDLKYGRNFGSFADDYRNAQQGLAPQVEDLSPPSAVPAPAPVQPAAPVTQPQPEPRPEPSAIDEVAPEQIEPPAAPESLSEPAIETETAPDDQVSEVSEPATPPELVAEVVMPSSELAATNTRPKVFAQGAQLVTVGEVFAVSFTVDEIADVFSAPMYVQYDPALFALVDAQEGNFLKQGSSPTIFTHTVLEGTGRIIVGLKQGAGGQGITGSGELFSMTFRALAPGKAEIAPSRTNFRNPSGERLRVETIGLNIEVSE